jgi:CHAT domain-containing protein
MKSRIFTLLICFGLIVVPFNSLCQNKLEDKQRIASLLGKYGLPITERNSLSTLLDKPEGIVQILNYLRSKKNYNATEMEVELPFLLLENDDFTKSLVGDKSNNNLVLNKYDSLFVDLSAVARKNNTFDIDKKAVFKNMGEVLFAELLINGGKSERFITLLIEIGEFGCNQHRRINSYQRVLSLVEGFLKGHRDTQFYIDANAKMAELYFNKDLITRFNRSFYEVHYSIMGNKNLQDLSNIHLLRELSYLYFKHPISHNIGDLSLRKTWPIIVFNFPKEFETVQLDQIYFTHFSTATLHNPVSYEESIKMLKENFEDDSMDGNRAKILLAKLYLKEGNVSALDNLYGDLIKLVTHDLHLRRDKYDFLTSYFLAKNESEKALDTINEFLGTLVKGNAMYRKEFIKRKIDILINSKDTELEELLEEEIYQLMYSFMNNSEIYPDYLRKAYTKIHAQGISEYAEILFKLDSVQTGENNTCRGDSYYYLYDYINELKGSIANSIPVEKLLKKAKNNSAFDRYIEASFADKERSKYISDLNLASNSQTFDSLSFKLNRENEELRLLLNQVIDTERKPFEIDSMLKGFTGPAVFLNMFDLNFKSLITDKYLIFAQCKLPEMNQTFLFAKIVEISKKDINPYQTIWNNFKLLENIGVEDILVSPDGELFKHNFNLTKTEDGSHLFEKYSIRYASSPKNFIEQNIEREKNENFVFFGNPTFNDEPSKLSKVGKDSGIEFNGTTEFELGRSGLKLLPYSEKEIVEIAKILKSNKFSSKQYLNESANEESIKAIIKPRVLHIATHGYFIDSISLETESKSILGFEVGLFKSQPLFRSGLLLASAGTHLRNNGVTLPVQNDGILTAYEVMNIDLKNTELVVLSACETGLGEIENAEGVYGLQRSFKIAGAGSILMSMSKVPDEATQVLMSKFYTNWIDLGLSKSESLKKAQLDMITSERFSDPINWSSFVLME